MQCPSCGREIPDSGSFCLHCGEPLISTTAPDRLTQEGGKATSNLCEAEPLTKIETMTEFERVYHWANVIGIPILSLLLLAGAQSDNDSMGFIFMAGIVLSGLLNRKLRLWVVRFLGGLFGSAAAVGCLGLGLVGILLLIPVILGGVIFLFVAAVYLWISSLVAIIREAQT